MCTDKLENMAYSKEQNKSLNAVPEETQAQELLGKKLKQCEYAQSVKGKTKNYGIWESYEGNKNINTDR